MVALFDDLRRAPTPLAIQSRNTLVSLVKEAQIQILRASLALADSPHTQLPQLSTDLRRFALWLEHAAFVDGHMEDSILEVMAALYEYAANLTDFEPSTIYRPPLNDLLRSAIASSAMPFTGKASVVGERIDQVLQSEAPASVMERHQLVVARCIVAFVSRRFQRCMALAETSKRIFLEVMANEGSQKPFTPTHHSEIAQLLTNALNTVSLGMLVGDLAWIGEGIEQLESLIGESTSRDDAVGFWLADRLLAIARSMDNSSMHRQLGFPGTPVPPLYRQLLAAEGFLELWSPQLLAVESGVLQADNDKHLVVSIPTGAGKSLIAEMLILSSLREQSGWAIYVVPSRALVNQVSQDLKRRLNPVGVKVRNVVAGPEQSIVINEELQILGESRTVVVMTPEKVDTYLRSASSAFGGCKLLILDEAHIVGDFNRGALAETLISRFLVQNTSMRVAVLSGVMSNPEDFAIWLGEERVSLISEQRRPTRQTFSIAVRQNPPRSTGEPITKFDKDLQRDKVVRKVEFSGGLVIVNESDDLTGHIEVTVPDVFSGHATERQRAGGYVRDRNESNSGVTDHTRKIVEQYARAPGTILAFVNNVMWVESISVKTKIQHHQFALERERLAEFAALELGSDHSLVDCCRKGVGYHHSRLPLSIQRAIEYALEEGWLKVVYATPTLREGVNTSASVVILGGMVFRNEAGAEPMSVMSFANVAGRAGRPRRETAGQIVLVPDELSETAAIDNGRRYILSGADARRVESQLGRLARSLEAAEEVLEALPTDDQRLLLGIYAAGMSSSQELSMFVDNTLWSTQEPDVDQLDLFVKRGSASLSAAEEKFGARLLVAARSSLALSSAEIIRDHIIANENLFSAQENESGQYLRDILEAMLSVGLSLEEVRPMVHSKHLQPTVHIEAVLRWVEGGSYQDVLEYGRESGLFKKSDKVGQAVKYCSDISNWLSWVAGAAWLIAEAELDEVSPLVGALPLMLKHGVPSIVDAYVALLGVSDRNAILQLGQRFIETGKDESISGVSDWLDTLDLHETFPSGQHFLRADLLRRQSFGRTNYVAPYVFAGFEALVPVPRGSEVELEREENTLYLKTGSKRVGVVTKGNLSRVFLMLNESGGNVFARTTSEISERGFGAFVVVPLRD